ncbi:NADH-quinone oxidoreductase subunit NuoF [Myxococcota bacterium]|nr:NADH-quinone oxidoreductase subunit NuoF [Myxococcota bacterium]MBU1381263.1 NADH-quinone oxidoreductase subunit NuoF [Myxococcota bacterium]MBU1499211.1 NADH-quinone oxidoreductase subunit NuoF [Myxococcota bacterium]
MEKFKSPSELESFVNGLESAVDHNKPKISVCRGTGCIASGASKVSAKFTQVVKDKNIHADVVETGCHGFCERGPLVVIHPSETFYQKVKETDVEEILDKTLAGGQIIPRLQYRDEAKIAYEKEKEVPFYKDQMRVVFGMNGHIDPTRIEDYMSFGGYKAFAQVITKGNPASVIDTVVASGLRGRGGAGFPAGLKWKSTAEASGEPKYIICNADEGDPGAFMDRSIMEGNPHSVLEGMLIGAYAIGASIGYIYIRNEYPLALERLEIALNQAREYGLLGENILGSGFNFDILISRGGGAFVCGESTALMESIEGRVGRPRVKWKRTAISGLWGKPTNINNVETWANVPYIFLRGVDWYTSIGTGDVSKSPWNGSKGTKIFSLVGKVNNTGLVEVPMGTTLRTIVFDIGGGIKDSKKGRTFKAVQTGGPSGGCIPSEFLDIGVDFDELTRLGSMMGSGGLIVMDDRTCMVEVARYFVDFLKEESCGKCTPCREGLRAMSNILNRIVRGHGRMEDLDLLEDLATTMVVASFCNLGQTAANPVLSTLKYFRNEYIDHIQTKTCTARQCTELIKFTINPETCTGCTICARKCPTSAISGETKKVHVVDQSKCVQCGVCFDVCNFNAVNVLSGPEIKDKLGV